MSELTNYLRRRTASEEENQAAELIEKLQAEADDFSRAYGLLAAENAALKQRVAEIEADRDSWRRVSERIGEARREAQEIRLIAEKRVAELEKDAISRCDLFWEDNDPEIPHESIDELVNYQWEQGAEIGTEFDVRCAETHPNVRVRLIWTGADENDGKTGYVVISDPLLSASAQAKE